LSVDLGSGKTLGLIQIQSRAARRGNINHRPIHALLHRDKVNKGRHVMILVHALHGLACRNQVESEISNSLVIKLPCVFMMIFPPNELFSGRGFLRSAARARLCAFYLAFSFE
jgi:hypothetical protein